MPFQRISTDFCGSPDHPRRAETAELATWGTKTPPRPPTAGGTPPAPARVRAAEITALGPTGAHLGGGPGGGAPAARWRPEPSSDLPGRPQGPSFHQAQGPTAPTAQEIRLCLPSYEKLKKKEFKAQISQFGLPV
jgi:hypothetical protein